MANHIPNDVQAMLNAHNFSQLCPYPHHGALQAHDQGAAAAALQAELQDTHTVSDIVLQLLAFRPQMHTAHQSHPWPQHTASSLNKVLFTLQFYKSGPIVTDTCLLVTSQQAQQLHVQQHMSGLLQGVQPSQQAQPATFLLVSHNKHKTTASAGLVLNFTVDGSKRSTLLPDGSNLSDITAAATAAAAAAHVEFCKYLLNHKLVLDVWDADSLLQVGLALDNSQWPV